uniref:Uncharacterized protein n=1 Tax=Anguilla anguilla TaxID=7936 RepID=A0A0E9PA81_ANGAN
MGISEAHIQSAGQGPRSSCHCLQS